MKKFVKSRWTYIFPQDKFCVLFNSLNLKTQFIDKQTISLVNFLKEPRTKSEVFCLVEKGDTEKKDFENIWKQFIQLKVIVENDADELAELVDWSGQQRSKKEKQMSGNIKMNALRVIITEKCNLDCKYCFVDKRKTKKAKVMSWLTLKSGIDNLAKLCNGKAIEVQFFGGEPLLEFELIKKAVSYINQLKVKKQISQAHFGITTNATLLTQEKAKFFKANSFLVSVSLDGWKKMNDLNRVFSNEASAYDKTIKGLKILRETNNEIGILVTPAPETIEDLANACEYIIKELGFKFITINTPQPVHGNWTIDGAEFSKQIQKCHKIAEENKAIINSFGTRVLFAINEEKPLIFSCAKYNDYYTATLQTDGLLSPCIVSWDQPDILSKFTDLQKKGSVFSKWKLTEPYFLNKCLNCPAMNVCGGPCPLEVYEMKKFTKPVDIERCKFFNDYLPWATYYDQEINL
ncbi:radical SAM protein [Candidatus Falkowbacteria bacterium]|jgi:uncharacterized protein|nr:radical SAM protein [Candidatus Falkowbacteria bacterium]MBT6573912.1 radical SAM protein [Candidatus Falkowbacteria bacterium]MBT7348187.1 radical SAM protein [Candidatus Falkowbacteria bacterium]MBT7501255.1 radical SAM protein [Candidatus Falkowbacteria bacterium]